MENFNIYAIDDGYGDWKGTNGKKIIRIPNVYADFKPIPSNDFKNEHSIDKDEYSDPLYSYISYTGDEGSFVIGETALKQSMDINWYGGEEKHKDIGFPIILKTFLGLLSDSESSVLDLLVMGLPCDRDTKNRHIELENIVLNHHKMNLVLSDGFSLNKDIHVNNLIVKKQPFGSFCDLLLDDYGDVYNKELANGFVVVVDIGSRTLNIYTINKMEEMNDLITTTNNGMYTSYFRVRDFVKNKIGFNIPTGKLPLVIKEGEFQGYDLREVIEKSHLRLANDIKTVLDTMFVNSYGYISHILFTGGGSEVLKEHLSNLFYKYNIIFLDRYATARGLRKYGLFRAKKMFAESTKYKNINGIKVRV